MDHIPSNEDDAAGPERSGEFQMGPSEMQIVTNFLANAGR